MMSTDNRLEVSPSERLIVGPPQATHLSRRRLIRGLGRLEKRPRLDRVLRKSPNACAMPEFVLWPPERLVKNKTLSECTATQ